MPAAAACGVGGAVEPGVDAAAGAVAGASALAGVAPAVALELPVVPVVEPASVEELPSAVVQESSLPVTGRRPSIRPVRVATTPFG